MLCFALSGYSLSANVMETLVKKGMKIEEIKKAASGLKVSDRLFCYSTLIRNTQESVWVRERLEGEYKSFNGYDLEHAVRLLISIGSMDALDYLVTRPEMINIGMTTTLTMTIQTPFHRYAILSATAMSIRLMVILC